jgi:transcription termination/antitermination protein NusA
MFDPKILKGAIDLLEEEKKIPKEKIIAILEQAVSAAYKKDFGKRDQVVRALFDWETGTFEFFQVKTVVDITTAYDSSEGDLGSRLEDDRIRFNSERHIWMQDALLIKNDVVLEQELLFPLETQEDFGRVAAQTAKQVLQQKFREVERSVVAGEYGEKSGQIVVGIVQKVEGGTIYVDLPKAVGVLVPEEQIRGEYYKTGERIRAFLVRVDESSRGVTMKLSRTHPGFVRKLFELETPEIATGVVEIRAIAREAGARTKIAVFSKEEGVDPIGSCVGQRGVRVQAVLNEISPEKVDIVEWNEEPEIFVAHAMAPAQVIAIQIDKEAHIAHVEVAEEHLSLAIGKSGQNVRLANKLTGWRIDVKGVSVSEKDLHPQIAEEDSEGFSDLASLKLD